MIKNKAQKYHSPRKMDVFKGLPAFTLAEVLITLGIIGIVAALTMPTLIQNYQKTHWVNQLKKSVSTLEQGFQKMLADEGIEHFIDLPQVNQESNCCETGDSTLGCQACFEFFQKYFKVIYENFNKGEDQIISFNDGSSITHFEFHVGEDYSDINYETCEKIKALGGSMCSEFVPTLEIDVNGKKGPNILGKDRFLFRVSGEGKLYPFGGKDSALYESQTALASNQYYWKNKADNCGERNQVTWPNYCAARVIENGWKIDY